MRVTSIIHSGFIRRIWDKTSALDFCIWTVIVVSIFFRFYSLSNLPGIHGDEANNTVKLLKFFRGEQIYWYTGSNNLPNFLVYGMMALAHLFLPISFFTLRLPAALFGLLCVISPFLLFRKIFTRDTTLILTLLIATLPIHIGYSRLAWDPATIPLVSIFCLYFAMRFRPFYTSLCFVIALTAHPTTVFLAPLLFTILLYGFLKKAKRENFLWLKAKTVVSILVPLAGLAVVILLFGKQKYISGNLISDISYRAMHPDEFRLFLKLYIQLLSGPTLYYYHVGYLSKVALLLHTIIFSAALFFLFLVFLAKRKDQYFFTLGYLTSLIIFYLVAGPKNMQPNVERYAIWMTIPSCIWVAMRLEDIDKWLQRSIVKIVILIASITLLFSFYQNYFVALRTQNSSSESTFFTGNIDPKQLAFGVVESRRDPSKKTIILTEDWWLYWAIKYLSMAKGNYIVTIEGASRSSQFSSDFVLPAQIGPEYQVYKIVWTGGGPERRILEEFQSAERTIIKGFGNKDIITIFEMDPTQTE